jgi:UDP-N-acetylmuramate dehydrogenase
VAAGEDWDGLVARAVAEDCGGIETMSGIPGTVGGTPVQNVGAYGQEVSETINSVRVLDTRDMKTYELTNAECDFEYRTSIFNTTERNRYIVLRVAFALNPGAEPRVAYADLKKYFAGASRPPTLQQVRDAVREIRLSKAMLIVPNDDDCRSAGSFFKNPIVAVAKRGEVHDIAKSRGVASEPPTYAAGDGWVKLSAGWLVENSGFHKGYRRGPVGISRRHALAIVNRGGARASDIIALKNEVQTRVKDLFGIELQPEPVMVGF